MFYILVKLQLGVFMKYIKRPSLKELEDRITEIENLNSINLSIDDYKSKLKLLFIGYTINSINLNPGFLIYRGIKYERKPALLSHLSYPPINTCKMGRANRHGVPVFYGATDKNVPFYELDAKPGERMVISEWTIQKDFIFNNVGYTEAVFKGLNSARAIPSFSPYNNSRENVLVQNFLAKTFSQKISDNNNYLYKITNAIAEKHYSEGGISDALMFKGLVYPTIRMNANADNFAITQLAIDKGFLKFEKVEYIEILKGVNDSFSYKILDVAFNICNKEIQWKNLCKNWIVDSSDEIYLVEEGNEILAYDSLGEVIKSVPINMNDTKYIP